MHIAMLIENMHQDLEVWCPIYRLQEAGVKVSVIGPTAGPYKSKLGYPITAELAADQARASDYDGVIVPGGYAPDLMRTCRAMVDLVRAVHDRGALVAAICHGSWMLASADIVRGRRVTGAPSIADDLRNAGAQWVDEAAVCDRNLVTSRKPSDIPAFSAAMMKFISA